MSHEPLAQVDTYDDTACPLHPDSYESKLISVTDERGVLKFELQRPDGGFVEIGTQSNSNSRDLRKHVASFLGKMAEQLAVGEAEATFKHRFQSEAESLFRNLLPGELARRIQNWPDNTSIGITTNESWVPWELLHDTKGFLWQRFLIYRLPKLIPQEESDSQTNTISSPNSESTTNQVKVVHVVGGGLEKRREGALEKVLPTGTGGCEIVSITGKSGDFVAGQLKNADIIHFDCHGCANPPMLKTAIGNRDEFHLSLSQVEGSQFQLRRGCFVFANACESDAPDQSYQRDRSFGRAFYVKGAVAFIGTLGKIPAEPAYNFADAFYTALAGTAAGNIGEAFRVARTSTTKHTAVIYVLYGNPLKMPAYLLRVADPP